MQWKFDANGQAHIENVVVDEVCEGHPLLNLYPAPFPSMGSCMNFCQKLGSRSPPLNTKQQWAYIQKNLEKLREVEDIWLALYDSENGGLGTRHFLLGRC